MSEHEMKEALQKSSRKPQAAEQAAPTTAEGSNSELVRLQRLVGNHALQRMLADNPKRTGLIIQTKMTVGAADDPYEREADAVASQVMAKRDVVQREADEEELAMKRMPEVQREADEEELAMKRIQRQDEEQPVDMSGSFDVNNDVESRINAASGSGQTIPEVHRDMFESSMGHDFSGVNIHADAQSDSLNKELGARAFTTGSDIFFRQGEYNPASSGGQELLAHELTHVVQQGGAASIQKKKDEE